MPDASVRIVRLGVLVVVATSLLAGCAGSQEPPAGPYKLSGTFTEDATEEEMQELGNAVQARGGTMAYLESYPVQFRATGLDEAGCGEVRTLAQGQAYVAQVGECALQTTNQTQHVSPGPPS